MPDPREVAAVTDAVTIAFQTMDIDAMDTDDWEEIAHAAIAADHQWLAEHAPNNARELLAKLKTAHRSVILGFPSAGWKREQELFKQAEADLLAAETALLALYQQPVIDEAGLGRAMNAYWNTGDALGADGEDEYGNETRECFEACMRAALEAFVAGGGGEG